MKETKTVSVSGYCDHLSKNKSIRVNYSKIDVLGDPVSYQKMTSYSCDYANECQKDRDCPIAQIAMQNQTW